MTRSLSPAQAAVTVLGSLPLGKVQDAMRRSCAISVASLLLAQGRCDDFKNRPIVPDVSSV